MKIESAAAAYAQQLSVPVQQKAHNQPLDLGTKSVLAEDVVSLSSHEETRGNGGSKMPIPPGTLTEGNGAGLKPKPPAYAIEGNGMGQQPIPPN